MRYTGGLVHSEKYSWQLGFWKPCETFLHTNKSSFKGNTPHKIIVWFLTDAQRTQNQNLYNKIHVYTFYLNYFLWPLRAICFPMKYNWIFAVNDELSYFRTNAFA